MRTRVLLTMITVALLAVSFTPWFRYDVNGSGPDGPFVLSHSVDAWRGSSTWSVAVVLAVVAAALGVAATLLRSNMFRVPSLAVGLGCALVAAGAWARQGWEIAHPVPLGEISGSTIVYTGSYVDARDPLPVDPYRIVRDQLDTYGALDGLGHSSGPTAASVVGGVLVAAALLVLAVQAARTFISPRDSARG